VDQRLAAGESGRRDDLLGLLLASYPADARIVRDQIVTFLVAGHETVAAALTWTLGLLAHHPDEQRQVRAEAHRELGDRAVGESDLERLPATRHALHEALRLYPPAWVITRSAAQDMVLGSRLIPAGSLVIISPWVLHRDPARWPVPDAFRPGRFAAGPSARAATTRGEYLPFGAGQRLCIGRDAALVEATVVLATLLHRFEFEPVDESLPKPDPSVTLRPAGGLRLRIKPVEVLTVSPSSRTG
jgi:cytochrome P450